MKNNSEIFEKHFESYFGKIWESSNFENLGNYFGRFQEIFQDVHELLPQFSELFLKNSEKILKNVEKYWGSKKMLKPRPRKKIWKLKKIDAVRNWT